jgi:two-component system LytT family sensor kinase
MKPMRARLTAALGVGVAWTALAVFFAVSSSLTYVSQGRAPVWGLSLSMALAQWWLWALLTPLVVWLARHLPLAPGRLAWTVPAHLVCGLGVALLKVLMENGARQWLLGVRPYLLINNVALQMLIYWALVGFTVVLDRFGRHQARAAEAEARLSQAQVQLLRSQLQPHFLFNALNAVSELIHEDPEKADRMIGLLSDLLRATLEAGDRPEVPLDEELQLAERYLAIQRIRFGDRLRVETSVGPACATVLVPHLCLQPLVENAIRHGLSARARGGTIWMTAVVGDRAVVLTVEDDGVGLGRPSGDGIGLANTRARLASLYGPQGSLVVEPRAAGGTLATIRVPLRHAEAS